MENITELNFSISSIIVKHLWPIRKILEEIGIIIDNENPCFKFRLYFNLQKVNQKSLTYIYNVDGISFAGLEIILLRNDKITYVDEIFKNVKEFKNVFVCKDLLTEIFRIIGFDLFIEKNKNNYEYLTEKEEIDFNNIIKDLTSDDTNINNEYKKNFKILEIFKKIMESFIKKEEQYLTEFETSKNNFINIMTKEEYCFLIKNNELHEIYKNINEKINNELNNLKQKLDNKQFKDMKTHYKNTKNTLKFKISRHKEKHLQKKRQFKIKTLYTMKEIEKKVNKLNDLKILKKNNLLIYTTYFEKTLFSELFNLISENTTIDSKTKYLKDNYINMANKIHNHLIGKTGPNLYENIKKFISCKIKL